MGRDDDSVPYPCRSHKHTRTVVEGAHCLTFRALLELIRGQMQTCLDEGVIEHGV